jgi:hypothetical protein
VLGLQARAITPGLFFKLLRTKRLVLRIKSQVLLHIVQVLYHWLVAPAPVIRKQNPTLLKSHHVHLELLSCHYFLSVYRLCLGDSDCQCLMFMIVAQLDGYELPINLARFRCIKLSACIHQLASKSWGWSCE